MVAKRRRERPGVSGPDVRVRRRAPGHDVDEIVGDLAFVADGKEQAIFQQRSPEIGAELLASVIRLRLLETPLRDQAPVLLQAEDRAVERVAALMGHGADHPRGAESVLDVVRVQ